MVDYVKYALLILLCGLAAAWVTREIRQYFEAALGEANTRAELGRIAQDWRSHAPSSRRCCLAPGRTSWASTSPDGIVPLIKRAGITTTGRPCLTATGSSPSLM